jgi:hypothetical protein
VVLWGEPGLGGAAPTSKQAEKRTFHSYYSTTTTTDCINLSITSPHLTSPHLTPSYRDTFVPLPFLSFPFPSLRLRSPFEVPSSPPYSKSPALGPAPFVLALLCSALHRTATFDSNLASPSPRESVRIHACDIELFDQSFSFSQVLAGVQFSLRCPGFAGPPLHCIERRNK